MLTVGLSAPYTLDSDEDRIDQDFDRRMVHQLAYPTYPIDPDTVVPPAPGGVPGKGRDPRAANPIGPLVRRAGRVGQKTIGNTPEKSDSVHIPTTCPSYLRAMPLSGARAACKKGIRT